MRKKTEKGRPKHNTESLISPSKKSPRLNFKSNLKDQSKPLAIKAFDTKVNKARTRSTKAGAKPAVNKKRESFCHVKRDDLERIVRERTEELRTHQIELQMQNEELRSAQQELEASRRKYVELYEFAPVGYFMFDANGLIRDVNMAGANQLELDKQALLKKPFSLFIPSPNDRLAFTAHKKRTFLTQQRQECDLKLRRRDGVVFYARLESIAVENVDYRAGQIRTAVADITRLKQAEEELKNANDELEKHVQVRTDELAKTIAALTTEISDRNRAEKTLSETQEDLKKAQALAHIGSWSLDLRSKRVAWSEELFRIFGIAPGTHDSELENIILGIVHPDDRRKVRQIYRQIFETSKVQP